MRFNLVAAVFLCLGVSATSSFGQTPQTSPASKLSQIANGALNGKTYTNDDLGITFLLPSDWTATVNPQMQTLFNPDRDALANRCTRILLEYDSKPGDSTAKGVVFAIDPGCLKVGPFPPPEAEEPQLEAFNRAILEIYESSTFFPPSGVQLYAYRGSGGKGRLFLGMAGAARVSPPASDADAESKPVQMNTLFVMVDVDKFWVGWAVVADEKAKNEFAKESRMTVK